MADRSAPAADGRDGVPECIEGWITDPTVSCSGGNEYPTPNTKTRAMTTNRPPRQRSLLVGPRRIVERLFLLGSTSSTGIGSSFTLRLSSIECCSRGPQEPCVATHRLFSRARIESPRDPYIERLKRRQLTP